MRITPLWWSWRDSAVITAVIGLAVFLFVGLLRRDTLMGLFPFTGEIDNPVVLAMVTIFVVLSLPFLFSFFAVYFMIRSRRWTLREVLFMSIPFVLLSLIFYLPLSHFYERSMAPREPFHAHLHVFPPPIEPVQDSAISIVFLGGSTTAWGGWTDAVEKDIQSAFVGHDVRVVNQGVPWYTTLQSLINYETNVRRTQPDIVVIMHAINYLAANADHSYYVNGPFRADYGHLYAAMSRLARTRSLFDLTIDVISHLFYWRPRDLIETDKFPGLDVFAEYYRRLVQLARLDGSEVVIITQPFLYKESMSEAELSVVYMDKYNGAGPDYRWSVNTALSGMNQYVASVREIAEKEEVTLIDLEANVPKTIDYLYDDCHYTEKGARLVADIVSNGLKPIILQEIETNQ